MKYFYVIILLLFFLSLNAQNKRDYIWLLADDHKSDEEGIQALKIDFNEDDPQFIINNNGIEFDQNNASICDEEGRLLFYTNGCAVSNANHNVMPNGWDINTGDFFDLLWGGDCGNGYPGQQDITILPNPASSSQYFIIHKPTEYIPGGNPSLFIDKMLYTLIDLELNNGLGDVVEKNIAFYQGRILSSYLTSIAHSNRNDWWIIQPKEKGNCFLQFLLNEQGFVIIDSTCISPEFTFYSSASGDAKFSPDGKTYAYYNAYDQLFLFDFDRTSGKLDNLRQFRIPVDTTFVTFSSIEFSPDSRFLYFSVTDSLWQLDLNEEYLEDGLEFIDSYDGYMDPFPTIFFLSTLAPNCKIYIRPGSSSYSMHVINQPNKKGKECNFQQHSIQFPLPTSTGGFPNFPRFRVDEDEVCDPTITNIFGEDVYFRRDLDLSPNPVSDVLFLQIPDNLSGRIIVFDNNARHVLPLLETNGNTQIKLDVNDLPSGIYTVEFFPINTEDRVFYSGRFVRM